MGLLTHAAAAATSPALGDPLEILRASGLEVDVLFTPMHGYWSDLSPDERPPLNLTYDGVPVISLHGVGRRPTAAMMQGLDVLMINIQGLGCNVNAHLNTLARCLEVAGELGIEVVVLDRPNPVGGLRVEGPLATPGQVAERGDYRLPLRHGLTAGEMALLLNQERRLGVPLSVVPMDGWRRGMLWQDTGLPWIAPSPALPTADAALAYGASVFVERSGVSVGRETYRPFTRLGASWITDPFRLAEKLNRQAGQAVRFRPAFFRSVDGRQRLGGVEMHIVDPHRFEWLETALVLISVLQEFAGQRFTPRFDLLGNPLVEEMLAQGRSLAEIKEAVEVEIAPWLDVRCRYLLYGDASVETPPPILWVGKGGSKGESQQSSSLPVRRPFLSLSPLELHLSPGERQPLQVAFIDGQGRRTLPAAGEIDWSVEGPAGLAQLNRLEPEFLAWSQSRSEIESFAHHQAQAVVVGGPETGTGFVIARWREWEVRRPLEVMPLELTNIRLGVHPGYLRIVIDMNREARYDWRLEAGILRITCYGRLGGKLDPEGGEIHLAEPLIQKITYWREPSGWITVEAYLTSPARVDTPHYENRMVFDLTSSYS